MDIVSVAGGGRVASREVRRRTGLARRTWDSDSERLWPSFNSGGFVFGLATILEGYFDHLHDESKSLIDSLIIRKGVRNIRRQQHKIGPRLESSCHLKLP